MKSKFLYMILIAAVFTLNAYAGKEAGNIRIDENGVSYFGNYKPCVKEYNTLIDYLESEPEILALWMSLNQPLKQDYRTYHISVSLDHLARKTKLCITNAIEAKYPNDYKNRPARWNKVNDDQFHIDLEEQWAFGSSNGKAIKGAQRKDNHALMIALVTEMTHPLFEDKKPGQDEHWLFINDLFNNNLERIVELIYSDSKYNQLESYGTAYWNICKGPRFGYLPEDCYNGVPIFKHDDFSKHLPPPQYPIGKSSIIDDTALYVMLQAYDDSESFEDAVDHLMLRDENLTLSTIEEKLIDKIYYDIRLHKLPENKVYSVLSNLEYLLGHKLNLESLPLENFQIQHISDEAFGFLIDRNYRPKIRDFVRNYTARYERLFDYSIEVRVLKVALRNGLIDSDNRKDRKGYYKMIKDFSDAHLDGSDELLALLKFDRNGKYR